MKTLLIILTSLLISGCLSSSPIVRYYVLNPVDQTALTLSKPLAIKIAGIQLPQYLDRSAIVTRTSHNRLRLSEAHQWAGNLRKNLLRVLSINLSRKLNTDQITVAPNRNSHTDYRVDMDIMQFELSKSGQIQLIAQWRLYAGNQHNPITTQITDLTHSHLIAEKNYDQIVTVMETLFSQLSSRIADAIQHHLSH